MVMPWGLADIHAKLASLRRFTVVSNHRSRDGIWYVRFTWLDDTDERQQPTADDAVWHNRLLAVAAGMRAHLASLSDARRFQVSLSLSLCACLLSIRVLMLIAIACSSSNARMV
jgi:hypothetical protein